MAWALKSNRAWGVAAGIAGCAVVGTVLKNWDQSESSQDCVSVSAEDSATTKKEPSRLIPHLPLSTVFASWTSNFKPTVAWDHNWDKRDPKSLVRPPKPSSNSADSNNNDYENELKKTTPKASRHLFLIRHGQYNMQANDDKGRFLTKLGKDQAHLTGKRLKEFNKSYNNLVHSTMTRARETAETITEYLPGVPVEKSDMLREGAPYPTEPPVGHWRPEEHQFFQDGARIEAAFRQYFHRADSQQTEDSHHVMVCHANVIRYFVCRALQIPPEAWLRMSLAHGSITHVIIRPSGRVVLRNLGDSGHMPADMVTLS